MHFALCTLAILSGCALNPPAPNPIPPPTPAIPQTQVIVGDVERHLLAALATVKGVAAPPATVTLAEARLRLLALPTPPTSLPATDRAGLAVDVGNALTQTAEAGIKLNQVETDNLALRTAFQATEAAHQADATAAQKRYDDLKSVQDLRARYAMAFSFALAAVAVVLFFGSRLLPLTSTIGIIILGAASLAAAGTGFALGWSASLPIMTAGKVAAWIVVGVGILFLALLVYWVVRAALAKGAVNPISGLVNGLGDAIKDAVAPRTAAADANAAWELAHGEAAIKAALTQPAGAELTGGTG